MNRCEPLEHAFGLRVGCSEDQPADAELPAEAGEGIGRPAPPAWIAPSRSHTSFSGSAPIRSSDRPKPHSTSGGSLENTSVPATTRDQHNSTVTT